MTLLFKPMYVCIHLYDMALQTTLASSFGGFFNKICDCLQFLVVSWYNCYCWMGCICWMNPTVNVTTFICFKNSIEKSLVDIYQDNLPTFCAGNVYTAITVSFLRFLCHRGMGGGSLKEHAYGNCNNMYWRQCASQTVFLIYYNTVYGTLYCLKSSLPFVSVTTYFVFHIYSG